MPYDAFNGSLVEQYICSDAGIQEVLELKRRITSSASIVSILHLPDVFGMARVERKSVYVLHMPDVSGMSTGHVWYGRNQSTNWDVIEV